LQVITMFYWIYDISTPNLGALFALVFVGVTWLATIFVRPFIRPFVGSSPGTNELVGYVLSCFCVFYGLLLGLLAVAAYQNFSEVEANVANEASLLSALYRDVSCYPEPIRQELQELLRDYTKHLIEESWPLQQKGIIPKGNVARTALFHQKVASFEPQTKGQEVLQAETLRQLNRFIEIRSQRLFSVTTGIPAILWYVVIVGAVVNILLLMLFEARLITQIFLGGLLAFYIGAVIFVIAAMDNPFRGEVSVSPEPFKFVYEGMTKQ
jgi:hypothetical protein